MRALAPVEVGALALLVAPGNDGWHHPDANPAAAELESGMRALVARGCAVARHWRHDDGRAVRSYEVTPTGRVAWRVARPEVAP